jgi:hypothetical protein
LPLLALRQVDDAIQLKADFAPGVVKEPTHDATFPQFSAHSQIAGATAFRARLCCNYAIHRSRKWRVKGPMANVVRRPHEPVNWQNSNIKSNR